MSNLVQQSIAPPQFNYQQQLGEQLASGSPKPVNIFANNNTYGVHSTHYIYEYLFVQVSEASYFRDYFPKLKLNERIADVKESSEFLSKLQDTIADGQKSNKYIRGTPDKNRLIQSQYSDDKMPIRKNSAFINATDSVSHDNNEYGLIDSTIEPRRDSIASGDDDSKK